MATKKATQANGPLGDIDLKAFAAQKAEIKRRASEVLAEKVELIRNILGEMKAIVEISGVSVDVGSLLSEFEEAREELDPNRDWNSSSAYC